ncbi:MAG TPA: nucleotidyltransferase [Chloroflexota bacterium]|nr:nucleotidyltransferase [Chloroflexota bacterium]
MSNSDDSLPPKGPTLREAFEALVRTLNERGIRYAIIGEIAAVQHIRVRTTDDIDALLTVPQIQLPALLEALRDRGFSVDLATTIREFRDHGLASLRFKDVVIDLIRPVIPAYTHVLERAMDAEIMGQKVRVCSAEGLIVMKLIAMRPQDETDIREVLTAYGARLDLNFVRAELDTFTAENDPRRRKFESWVQQAGGGD